MPSLQILRPVSIRVLQCFHLIPSAGVLSAFCLSPYVLTSRRIQWTRNVPEGPIPPLWWKLVYWAQGLLPLPLWFLPPVSSASSPPSHSPPLDVCCHKAL